MCIFLSERVLLRGYEDAADYKVPTPYLYWTHRKAECYGERLMSWALDGLRASESEPWRTA